MNSLPKARFHITNAVCGARSFVSHPQLRNDDLGIGNQTQNLGGPRQGDGILDGEARVMQAARSPGWAKLDCESQRESLSLLKFGGTRTTK
jgi:hypothetical protein